MLVIYLISSLQVVSFQDQVRFFWCCFPYYFKLEVWIYIFAHPNLAIPRESWGFNSLEEPYKTSTNFSFTIEPEANSSVQVQLHVHVNRSPMYTLTLVGWFGCPVASGQTETLYLSI